MRRKYVGRCHSCREGQAHTKPPSSTDLIMINLKGGARRADSGPLCPSRLQRLARGSSQHTINPSRGDSDPRTAVEFRGTCCGEDYLCLGAMLSDSYHCSEWRYGSRRASLESPPASHRARLLGARDVLPLITPCIP
jgi:hypothetical protein